MPCNALFPLTSRSGPEYPALAQYRSGMCRQSHVGPIVTIHQHNDLARMRHQLGEYHPIRDVVGPIAGSRWLADAKDRAGELSVAFLHINHSTSATESTGPVHTGGH